LLSYCQACLEVYQGAANFSTIEKQILKWALQDGGPKRWLSDEDAARRQQVQMSGIDLFDDPGSMREMPVPTALG
jgi:hypothetical protein